MGAIFRALRLRDPRVVPTEPVEVDWSHPLSDGLVIFVTPGVSARNLAEDAGVYGPGSYVGSVGFGQGSVGPCMNLTAGSTSSPLGVTLSCPAGPPNGDYSVFSIVLSTAIGQNFLGEQGATGRFDLSNQNQYRFELTPEGGGNTSQSTYFGSFSYGNIPLNTWTTCGGSTSGYGCFASLIGTQDFGWSPTTTGPGQIGSNSTFDIGQRLDGYQNAVPQIALGAKWLRGLSTDECFWLAAEPFAMLRPKMRRRYFTVSSGSIITTRGILAAEWLATQQAKEVVATEMSGLLSRSSEVFAEFDQAVIRNDVMPLEIAVTAKKTATIPTEYNGATLSALSTSIEYLDLAATSEQSSLEYLGSTMAEGTIPAEWLATSVASAIVPIEWAGAALVTSGATIALEWMAPLSGGLVSSVEFLTALGTNVTLNAAWSGSTLANVSVTLETGKTLQVSDIVAADWAAALSVANVIPTDWVAGRAVSLTIPVEWSGSAGAAVQANALMSIEWAVASLIVPDWRFAVTFLPTIERVGFQTPVDEIGFNEPIDEVVLI